MLPIPRSSRTFLRISSFGNEETRTERTRQRPEMKPTPSHLKALEEIERTDTPSSVTAEMGEHGTCGP